MQVGSLGDIIFETSANNIITPSNISSEHSARYASHEVQGAPPRLEFLARELSAISFGLRFCATFVNPIDELNRLKIICHEGKVVRLILGGINQGDVIIEKVSESWKHTAPKGQSPFIIDVNISLKEYL